MQPQYFAVCHQSTTYGVQASTQDIINLVLRYREEILETVRENYGRGTELLLLRNPSGSSTKYHPGHAPYATTVLTEQQRHQFLNEIYGDIRGRPSCFL